MLQHTPFPPKVCPGKPLMNLRLWWAYHLQKNEADLTRNVLTELNLTWEGRFSHSFTKFIQNIPECNLANKKTKVKHKREEQVHKWKISHINDQFASNTTMSVLAEAESLSSYGRKRLALSYEKPSTPQRVKSHFPNENMAWDITGAMTALENFSPDKK